MEIGKMTQKWGKQSEIPSKPTESLKWESWYVVLTGWVVVDFPIKWWYHK